MGTAHLSPLDGGVSAPLPTLPSCIHVFVSSSETSSEFGPAIVAQATWTAESGHRLTVPGADTPLPAPAWTPSRGKQAPLRVLHSR